MGKKMVTEKTLCISKNAEGLKKWDRKRTLCIFKNAEGHSEFMKHSNFILN